MSLDNGWDNAPWIYKPDADPNSYIETKSLWQRFKEWIK